MSKFVRLAAFLIFPAMCHSDRESVSNPEPLFAFCVAEHLQIHPTVKRHFTEPLFATLVLASTEDEQIKLKDAVVASNIHLEARFNPLLVDLEESSDPDTPIHEWISETGPKAAILEMATRGQWCGADGFCVQLANRERGCPMGWALATDPKILSRAQFLAWPYGHARRMSFSSETEAQSTALALRSSDDGTIGLVITAADRTRLESDLGELGELGDLLARHEALSRAVANETNSSEREAFPVLLEKNELITLGTIDAMRVHASAQ